MKNDKEQTDAEENCGARAVAFCVFHWLDSKAAELVQSDCEITNHFFGPVFHY